MGQGNFCSTHPKQEQLCFDGDRLSPTFIVELLRKTRLRLKPIEAVACAVDHHPLRYGWRDLSRDTPAPLTNETQNAYCRVSVRGRDDIQPRAESRRSERSGQT